MRKSPNAWGSALCTLRRQCWIWHAEVARRIGTAARQRCTRVLVRRAIPAGCAKPMAKAAKGIVLWAWGRARALQDCNRGSASALSLLRRGPRSEVARGSDRRGCLIDVAQSRCGSENAQRGSWVKGWPIESKTWLIRDWLSDKWLVQSLSRHEVSTE